MISSFRLFERHKDFGELEDLFQEFEDDFQVDVIIGVGSVPSMDIDLGCQYRVR